MIPAVIKFCRGCETVKADQSEAQGVIMAYGDQNDFGWCNIIVKFLLFLCNFIIWVSKLEISGCFFRLRAKCMCYCV